MKIWRHIFCLMTVASAAWLQGATPPAPLVGLSLRGVGANEITQSEPLHVAVRLQVSEDEAGPITLAPAAGTWADAVTVEIARSDGSVVVRAKLMGRADAAQAILDKQRTAGGIWRLSSEESASLAPGDYLVRARLVVSGGAGWTGTAESAEMPLRVVASSGTPDRQMILAQARDALITDQLAEAARILDDALAGDPRAIDLLLLRARVALAAGNPVAARLCVLGAFEALPAGAGHPPLELSEIDRSVKAALEAMNSKPAPPVPPAWSWPPDAVLERPAVRSAPVAATP